MREKVNNLELFRGLLAVGVFGYHAYYNMSCNFGLFNRIFSSAVYYMTAFFILSGLVVGISNSNIDVTNISDVNIFLKKRVKTVFPLYMIVFLFGVLLSTHTIHDVFLLAVALPFQLIGMANVVQNEIFFNSGTWFFTNILLCYLVFPYINLFMRNINSKKLRIVTVALILLIIDAKWVEYYLAGAGIYRNPIIRIMEFSVGVCLAKTYSDNKNKIKWGGIVRCNVYYKYLCDKLYWKYIKSGNNSSATSVYYTMDIN